MADCLVVAAMRTGDVLATADPDLARAAGRKGSEVLGLPDPSGRSPAGPGG